MKSFLIGAAVLAIGCGAGAGDPSTGAAPRCDESAALDAYKAAHNEQGMVGEWVVSTDCKVTQVSPAAGGAGGSGGSAPVAMAGSGGSMAGGPVAIDDSPNCTTEMSPTASPCDAIYKQVLICKAPEAPPNWNCMTADQGLTWCCP